MSGSAEAEQSHPFAGLHARHAQAAKTDDPRAEQRSRLQIIETRGQRKYKIGARPRVFGVTAIHRVAGKGGRIAEVLHARPAVPTLSVNAAHPGDAHSSTRGELSRGATDDLAHNLVAGNEIFRDSGGSSPSTMCRSVRQTPHARTRNRTLPGSSSGWGTSVIRSGRFEMSCGDVSTAAFMGIPPRSQYPLPMSRTQF